LARDREQRMKQVIFRGLYEENLSLLGRTTPRAYLRRRLPRAAKIALFTVTLALGVLFTGSSLAPVFFPVVGAVMTASAAGYRAQSCRDYGAPDHSGRQAL
jgi:hypothetical protein